MYSCISTRDINYQVLNLVMCIFFYSAKTTPSDSDVANIMKAREGQAPSVTETWNKEILTKLIFQRSHAEKQKV